MWYPEKLKEYQQEETIRGQLHFSSREAELNLAENAAAAAAVAF